MDCDLRKVNKVARQFKPMRLLDDYAPEPAKKLSFCRALAGITIFGGALIEWGISLILGVMILLSLILA